MRITAIRGRNLASLSGDFEVDFDSEPLKSSGLFAITGPTGAGKSTLLDAVCLALFAEIPRLRAASSGKIVAGGEELGAKDARSILRHGAGDGFAEVDFIMPGGAAYRARWEVRRARGAATGSIQNYSHSLTRTDTGEGLGGTRTETKKAISDIIGLTADQFTRAVLLAQGDFEAFIRADANERALLLEKLTGSDIYARLGKAAYDKAKALERGLDAIELQIKAQNGLGDEERLTAEATLATAETAHGEAQTALKALEAEQQRQKRGAELVAQIADCESAHSEALAAQDAAAPRRVALEQARAAFALAPLYGDRLKAEAALARSDKLIAESENALALAETTAKARDEAAQAASLALGDEEAKAKALSPQLDAARLLDRQLAEAEATLARAKAEAETRAEAAKSAGAVAQDAAKAHSEAEARHRAAADWCAANAPARALAEREGELAEALAKHGAAQTRHAALLVRRGEFEEAEHSALKLHARTSDQRDIVKTALQEAQKAKGDVSLARPADGALSALSEGLRRISLAEQALERQGHARAALSEATTRHGELAQSLTEAQALAASHGDALPALESALSEARRAFNLSDAASDQAAELLRERLVEGEPCPVCGADDHNLSALESLLGDTLAKTRARVEALEQEHQAALVGQKAAQTEAARLTAALADAEAKAATLATALAPLEQAAQAALLALGEGVQADGLPILRAETETRQAEALTAQSAYEKAAQAADAAQSQFNSAQTQEAEAANALRLKAQALAECQNDLATLGETITREAEALDRALAPLTDWRALPDPAAWLAQNAQEWRRNEAERSAAEAALPALADRRNTSANAAQLAEAQSASAKEAEQASQTTASQRKSERAALLSGESVATVEARRDATLATARNEAETTRNASEEAQRALASARTALDGARNNRSENEGALETAKQAFAEALAETGLAESDVAHAVQHGAAALEAEAKALAELASAVAKAATLLDQRREDLARHQAVLKGAKALSPEALATALVSASEALDLAATVLEDARLKIRQDDAVREKTAELRAQLAEEAAKADVWLRLNTLIGCSTGATFRKFAQGLTLDRLLDHANARLAELKPRYSLERGSGGDMLMQVVDNDMGGQVRGLHNLSGGERFLVSLALALGLAEMSGTRGLTIESLFIDEGFGALDPTSLGQALALLETLHATGRRVGIISHVEDLKERIPVKIEVTPTGTGTGTSRIEVVVG